MRCLPDGQILTLVGGAETHAMDCLEHGSTFHADSGRLWRRDGGYFHADGGSYGRPHANTYDSSGDTADQRDRSRNVGESAGQLFFPAGCADCYGGYYRGLV